MDTIQKYKNIYYNLSIKQVTKYKIKILLNSEIVNISKEKVMRLLSTVFIALCLSLNICIPINAKAPDFYEITSITDDTMTIYFSNDNITYDFINDGNTITVLNNLTKDVIFVSQIKYINVGNNNFNIIANNGSSALIADYERWNNIWSEYRRGQIQLPDPSIDNFISLAAGLLLSGSGILGSAASTLIGIATIYRDRRLDKAYFIQYYRTNLDCGILAKTYAKYYTNSNYTGFIGSSEEGHMWTDTPWDYSYPAPCRVLVNTYPL